MIKSTRCFARPRSNKNAGHFVGEQPTRVRVVPAHSAPETALMSCKETHCSQGGRPENGC